jgi:DNA polymerase-3 subunit alpha
MFTPLHVHTHYSALDGMCQVPELVKRAKEIGCKAVAITDHGTMSGVYDLYKQCKKEDVQPIYGIEFYHRVEGIEKRLHLIAYAKTMKGLKNLYKLHELSYKQAEAGAFGKRFPIITYDDLFKHKEDIVICTACVAGHIPYLILQQRSAEVYSTVEMLKVQFGDDFYLELQNNTLDEQTVVNRELIALSKLYNIKTILTCDTHYIFKSDAKIHEMLLCMQTQAKMSNPNRFKFSVNDFWLKTEKEMMQNMIGVSQEDIRIALNNTNEIANKCSFELEIPKAEEALPRYSDDEKKALRVLTTKGWKEKKHGKTKKEFDRVNHELDIIEQKGYSGYFLIVSDYINWAKDNNIVVGGGRGSVVGSFVAYLSGITSINPIDNGLLFERFLNPERYTSPDADVDFSDQDAVIGYLQQRWGEDNVSKIISFGTLTAKAVIRKVLSIHGFDMTSINLINKSLPSKLNLTLKDCEQSGVFMKFKEKYPDLFNAMYRLEGTIDHVSQHAAGVLITPKPVREFVPAQYDGKILISGFDKYMLEELNLYKFDILKLTTLNVVDGCIKNIRQTKGIEINFDEINRSDNNIYSALCAGNVFGVFQFEKQKDFITKMQPRCFADLTALNALVRPGTGNPDEYHYRKNGGEFDQIKAEHGYMGETYHTITYQEQIMMRVHTLAGWTLGKGDSLRKMKNISSDKELEEQFKRDCKSVGIVTDDTEIAELWKEVVDALEGGYSFNKSHACSYADLAYQTAWLKHYYPVEYMAALMTSRRTDAEEIAECVNQCKREGIKILPPDINKSDETYKVENNAIRFSINTIKGVGQSALKCITELLPVSSFDDFISRCNTRVVDKTVVTSLIKAGAFDEFEQNRYKLLSQYYSTRKTKQDRELAEEYNLKTSDFNKDVIARMEKEALGFYLTSSPFDTYSFKPLEAFSNDKYACIGGEITKVKIHVDKNGNKMAFVTLLTQFGAVDTIVFAKQYALYSEQIKVGSLLMVEGIKDGDAKIKTNKITQIA